MKKYPYFNKLTETTEYLALREIVKIAQLEKLYVKHINGNTLDNRLENLTWGNKNPPQDGDYITSDLYVIRQTNQ